MMNNHQTPVIEDVKAGSRRAKLLQALRNTIVRPGFIEANRLGPFKERAANVDVILDLMIHDLDIILSFIKAPVKSVSALGVPVLSDKVDIANARLTFASGCVANVTASRITGKIMQKIRFFGLEGYHAVDCRKRELVSLGRGRDAQGNMTITENPVEVKPLDPLEEEIRAFVRAVAGRTSPPVSGTDGRNALDLALRINEAIEKNQARNPLDLTAPTPLPAPPLSDGPPAGDQVQL